MYSILYDTVVKEIIKSREKWYDILFLYDFLFLIHNLCQTMQLLNFDIIMYIKNSTYSKIFGYVTQVSVCKVIRQVINI